MSLANEAIRFNNTAIASLRRGESVHAVDYLKKAVGIMMNESDRASREEAETSVVPPMPNSSETFRSVQGVYIPTGNPLADDDHVFLMYPRPFEIVTPPTSEPQEVGFHRCLVVILYNLAFAFDTIAQSKAGIPAYRDKFQGWCGHAIKLYRLALQVASARSKAEIDSIKCVLLATSNNLGRLSHAYEDTKDCLRMSLDLLGNQETASQMSAEDYELLFGSLAPFLCVKDFLLPVAPAA